MALVALLYEPLEHGSIIHIRFRAFVPFSEKEIAVTSMAICFAPLRFSNTRPSASYTFSLIEICLIPLCVLGFSLYQKYPYIYKHISRLFDHIILLLSVPERALICLYLV